ncbi:MAG TPA: hypothetical protein VGH89_23220 [Pseudonocardia sp.]|jgi:hypothetical protein
MIKYLALAALAASLAAVGFLGLALAHGPIQSEIRRDSGGHCAVGDAANIVLSPVKGLLITGPIAPFEGACR